MAAHLLLLPVAAIRHHYECIASSAGHLLEWDSPAPPHSQPLSRSTEEASELVVLLSVYSLSRWVGPETHIEHVLLYWVCMSVSGLMLYLA